MSGLSLSPFALIILVVGAAVLLALFKGTIGAGGPPAPERRPFLTPRESAMLSAIEQILPAHRIHAQVAMGALLRAPRGIGRRTTPADRNAFAQKIVDFVVQDREDGAIVALIEVDDHTHNPARDRARDAMTARAGYRTIRIPARAKPTLPDVRLALMPLLHPEIDTAAPAAATREVSHV